jgi:hypothetical protein
MPTEQQIIKAAEMANKQQRELYEQAIRADERSRLRGEIEKKRIVEECHSHEEHFKCQTNQYRDTYNQALIDILSLLQ